ncbi:maleylpyruvate isomerase family mycothiol-dependent enzyme [Streptomyces camelliae]|uniref:Maleylpyruvate isomerase family mycothiol-dependent enzyme n=1 Tax=Streptomyces camelliae TaxID=3004093 RepID=A0ABY7NX88_9ACTN|nr:maleylpyruvate isomerase family mycothiol-dependent enzyme [Streptomyces sp. HUAS 2-6]WBO61708.1 maleylpyruvate isomerase family mycothiol-dependent enzyme [Streptomyces sp. HUAS 2-6]
MTTRTTRHDLTVTVPWMREGTAVLTRVADGLTDDDLSAASALPGWTRAHVIGHVARNAEALTRLATWARTGVPNPMYANRGQRAAEIESSATLPPEVLRSQLTSTAAELGDALAALDATTWQAEVRSALGRTVPAAQIPWMRVREVWLHAIDLASGTTFADLPAPLTDVLLDDVTATLSTRPVCPAVRLAPTDRDRTWDVGPTPAEPRAVIEAPASELLAWTTGRTPRPTAPVTLPTWL